jgi:hypothetical protein
MEYRTLGRSGCAVSTLTLGTTTFGSETDEDAHAQLDAFVEAGGTLIDTADVYATRTAGRAPTSAAAWWRAWRLTSSDSEWVYSARDGPLSTRWSPSGGRGSCLVKRAQTSRVSQPHPVAVTNHRLTA